MGLPVPELDDKTFDELVNEARARIARYAREWTDHNVHDPGITFIELFAWLAEMQIYQLNRVTDENYRKFLKLVGLYPFDAQPAKVDITFENVTGEKTIEVGTQVITEVGGERIVFETEEDFTLIPVVLKKVITAYDSQTIDNTSANEKGDVYFAAFGEKAPVGATLKLGFEYLFSLKPEYRRYLKEGAVSNELSKAFEDNQQPLTSNARLTQRDEKKWTITDGMKEYRIEDSGTKLNIYGPLLEKKELHITFALFEEDLPSPGSHGDEPAQVYPSASVVWEYWNGKKWNERTMKKDTTLALTRSGRIVFTGPSDMDKKDDLYWIRCRLKEECYEIVPQINRISLTTISAVQVETINEKVGEGLGIPEQKVQLKKKPVIKKVLFSVGDVLDWCGLLQQIKDQVWSGKPSPGKRIWSLFDRATQILINQWKGDQEPDDALKYGTIKALNKVLESRDLYEINSFKDIKLAEEFKRLLVRRLDIASDAEVKALNRFLIEAAYADKIAKSTFAIRIRRENGEWEDWYEVDDFESSGPDDPHYMFDPEEGEITFGNGLNGRVPLESQKIRASYKTTLGAKGNTPEGQKWWINNEGFEGIPGKNQKAATGGKDAEAIEKAKARARKDFREHYRAITSEDYEQLALSTPGLRVARAKAIPNYNPDYPCIAIPGTVTVVVFPHTSEGTVKPDPGEGFIQTILNHLEKHRLVTTDVHVIKPEYVKVSVKCKVHVNKRSSPTEVKKRVKDALNSFLAPLKGGPERNGWPFGRSVFPSEIYQIIDKVEGVDYATGISITAEGYQKEGGGDAIKIPPIALVFSGDHEVEIIGEKEEKKNDCTRI